MLTNHSLPAPSSARFTIDQNHLYFLRGQQEAQVPVTNEMRVNAVRVDLTACNSDPTAPPIILKFVETNTFPYYVVKQGSPSPTAEAGCQLPANPADDSSATMLASGIVAGSVFFLIVPHWALWLLWSHLQCLSLTVNLDNFPDRYRAYMASLALLNFQGWGWGDRVSMQLQAQYPCTPECCGITTGEVWNNSSSSLAVEWTVIDQLPPTAINLAIATGGAFVLGVVLLGLLCLCSRCTVRASELRVRHSALLPLLPLSLAFRVAVLGYTGLNYAVYQHLTWFSGQSEAWTTAAWALMGWHVALLAAYLLFPYVGGLRCEFALASMFLDERTNSKLRSAKSPTCRQRLAIFWPFVGLLHNHLYGLVVAVLQPDRSSVSFVSSVTHAADSRVAMGALVGLSLLQVVLFAFIWPYSSKSKNKLTLFSLISSASCLFLLLVYTMQQGTTPSTAPTVVLTLVSIASFLAFCLLAAQMVREFVGDETFRQNFSILAMFSHSEDEDPLLP